MILVAVRSVKGGSGATTTAAHLAAALHAEHLPVLAIDLCSSNMLRLYFGMNWSDKSGLAVQIENNQPWYQAAFHSDFGIDFVPHGNTSGEQNELILSSLFAAQPNWLKSSLEQLDLPADCWVILDCPSHQSQINSSISAMADHTLLLITADPACYAALQNCPPSQDNQHYLVNRFNPFMAVEKDLYDLLQEDYRHSIVPLNIHSDESVRESLAYKQTVFSCAPHSQAAHDYTTLATWLRGHTPVEVARG